MPRVRVGLAQINTVVGDLDGNVERITAAIDDGLNDIAYIVPGLGDAGDRQFGPR